MHVSRTGARAAECAAVGLILGVLSGCPQLLDDTFKVKRELPQVGLEDDPDPAPAAPAAPTGPDAGRPAPMPVQKTASAELRALLAHRYDFDGRGNTVLDSIGTAHGTSIGVSLDGSGRLSLASNDQYVDLPSGLISKLESVSIECWVNWAGSSANYWRDGTGAWQNLFTFGTSDQGEGRQGTGTRYIYLTPQPASNYGSNVRAGYSLTGFNSESFVSGDRPLPVSGDSQRGTQVVYVVDSAQNRLSIYIDGALEVSEPSSQQVDLSEIPDVNNWLGHSQFLEAAGFDGELLDVRIYGSALSAKQVELSFELGPDAEL